MKTSFFKLAMVFVFAAAVGVSPALAQRGGHGGGGGGGGGHHGGGGGGGQAHVQMGGGQNHVHVDGNYRGSYNPGAHFDGNHNIPNTARNFDGRSFDGRNFNGHTFDGRNVTGYRGVPGANNAGVAAARNFNHSWYNGSWANRMNAANANLARNSLAAGLNPYGAGYRSLGYGGLGSGYGLGYGPFGYSGYGYGGGGGLGTLLRLGSMLTGNGYGYGMGYGMGGLGGLGGYGLGGLGGYGGYGLGGYGGYGLFGGYPLGWGYGSGLGNLAYMSGYLPYTNPYYTSNMGGFNYSQPIPTTIVSNDQPNGQQLFDQAVAAFRAGDYTNALSLVDNAIQQNPSDSVMHEFRALTLFAQGNYPSAAATIHSVLAVGPGWDWATMSNLYNDVDVYTAQLRNLENAVRSNPNEADTHFLLAYHYTTAGHPDAAEKQLADVVRLNSNDKLAADLLKMNQVAQQAQAQQANPAAVATAQAPPQQAPAQAQAPAGPPVDPKALVGSWHAERPDGTKFDLQMNDDKQFTWKVNQNGKEQDLKGTFGVENDLLALESPQAGGMVGHVEVKDPNLMTFKMLGAPKDDQGLTFRR